MRRKFYLILLVLLNFSLFETTFVVAKETEVELNVSAAASLKDVMLEIKETYSVKNPKVKINFNFASSGTLQAQIERGAPVDLYISAAKKEMNDLTKKGLVKKESCVDLLENRLVLIVPRNSKLDLVGFEDLQRVKVQKIGIGAPEIVPAGRYAREVLEYFELWDKVQTKLVVGMNVRAVLTYVETGNVDAGFVYRTDAVIGDEVKIVATAPVEACEAIIYPAAILAKSKQVKIATKFLKYLQRKETELIFKKYGFQVMKK